MKGADSDVICFDADFTLIKYACKEFTKLQYVSMAKCMIKLGAPKELLTMIDLDTLHTKGLCGLIADLRTGYILKISSNNVIIKAYYGIEEVLDLHSVYGSPPIYRLEHPEKYFIKGQRIIFFTHFSIGASVLWQNCVELVKTGAYRLESYVELSEIHRNAVHMNYLDEDRSQSEFYPLFYGHPERYLLKVSDEVKQKLQKLRESGRKLVVVTNSYHEYSTFIFEYSYGRDWHSYFDAYVFAAGKPEFFYASHDLESILTLNLDGETYQRGSSKDLKQKVEGHRYIFIGDHYISDVHGPKHNDWATIAIVEELYYEKSIVDIKDIDFIENTQYKKPDDDIIDYYSAWGSHFKDGELRTYWWDFLITHADAIAPSLEAVFSYFSDINT
jgi:HAD superfamily 5'-nucleotidase-like hydrolase